MRLAWLLGFLFALPFVAACPDVTSLDTQSYLEEIPDINEQLARCPVVLPESTGLLIRTGEVRVDIEMRTGKTESLKLALDRGRVMGVERGTSACVYSVSVSEVSLDGVLVSVDRAGALGKLYRNDSLTIRGCTAGRRMQASLLGWIVRLFSSKGTPDVRQPIVPPEEEIVEKPIPDLEPGDSLRVGKPSECDETFLPSHSAYVSNQDLWRDYSTNSAGVCQFQPGVFPNSQCVHFVQLVNDGAPYFLCWYDE